MFTACSPSPTCVLRNISRRSPHISIRYVSDLSSIQDCQTYLTFCKENQISLESTVFNGTLYELYCKLILEKSLNCKQMVRVGGSYDNGLDIFGRWDLNRFYKESKKLSRGKETKLPAKSLLRQSIEYCGDEASGSYSLENDIFALVQCKNFSRRIKASVIRELSGIYNFHVKNRTGRNSIFTSYMFLISASGLTPQGLTQMNTSNIPIIHLVVPPLRFKPLPNTPLEDSLFSLANWHSDGLQSSYLNPTARSLLAGLNLELQLQVITKSN